MSAVASDIRRVLDTPRPQTMRVRAAVLSQQARTRTIVALVAGSVVATAPAQSAVRHASKIATTEIARWSDYKAATAAPQRSFSVSALADVLSSVFASPEFTVEDYTDVEEGWTREVLTVHFDEDEHERDVAEERFYAAVDTSSALQEALSSVVVSFSSRRVV